MYLRYNLQQRRNRNQHPASKYLLSQKSNLLFILCWLCLFIFLLVKLFYHRIYKYFSTLFCGLKLTNLIIFLKKRLSKARFRISLTTLYVLFLGSIIPFICSKDYVRNIIIMNKLPSDYTTGGGFGVLYRWPSLNKCS